MQRADDVAGARQLVAVLGLGQAEVGDPDVALGVEQEVRGLDVAVQNALLMSIFEGLGHLDAEPRHAAKIPGLGMARTVRIDRRRSRMSDVVAEPVGDVGLVLRVHVEGSTSSAAVSSVGSWPVARAQARALADLDRPPARHRRRARFAQQPLDFRQDGVQSVSRDELHGVIMEAVVLADAKDRHDVRVVQPRRRAGLAPEPLQPGRVAEMVEGERLERHVPAQRLLDRLVDDPHAAGPDRSEQHVFTQPLGRSMSLAPV